MEDRADILKTITRLAQSGEWQKVILEYSKILANEPDNATLHNSMGDAYVKLGDNRKAFEHYLRVLDDMQKKGNSAKLPFLYKKISKLDPRKFDLDGKALHETIAKTVKARELYEAGDYENAAPLIKEAIRVVMLTADLYMMAGDISEKATDIGNAVENYVKALRIMVEKNRKEEAMCVAEKVMKLDPGNVDAAAMAAEDLVLKGKKQEAEDMFKGLLITLAEKELTASGKEMAHRAMLLNISYGPQFYAYFLFKDGKFEDAKKVLEVKYDLTTEEKLLLGKIYYKTSEFDKAKAMLLSLEPDVINENIEILEQIGDVYLKLREHRQASSFYMKAVRKLKDINDLDHTIMMANKVLNVDADNLEVHEIMLDVFNKKGIKNKIIDTLMKLATLYDINQRPEDAIRIKNTLAKIKMVQ